MEIKNEEHAREMIRKLRKLPVPTQKRDLQLAIQRLELSCMYYEQRDYVPGVTRCQKCIVILKDHLATLAD